MTARRIRNALVIASCLVAAEAWAQSDLSESQIIGGLQAAGAAAPAIDPAVLAQEALANVGRKPGAALPAWSQLAGLAQLTVEINFEYNSVAIVPESYRAIGLMADALHHPILLPYKFLIVGHTDSTGDPKYNLGLSQKRADAIKEALSTTFAVNPNRLFTVGVGEEEPIEPAQPTAAINRRVQVINIGEVK
jgi:outer membrane protein OmpA-like peptidoglycan-associated protein